MVDLMLSPNKVRFGRRVLGDVLEEPNEGSMRAPKVSMTAGTTSAPREEANSAYLSSLVRTLVADPQASTT